MKSALVALTVALAPFAADAAEIELIKPLHGASLIGVETDMSVYFTKSEDDAFRVHVSYIGKQNTGQPQLVQMMLCDGDAVSFSLPGHMGEIYSFSRSGDVLSVTNDRASSLAGVAG